MILILNLYIVENKIKEIKESVAKSHGYSNNILGTRWEYAMISTHRTKAQIKLYEEVLLKPASANAIEPPNRCQWL